VKQSSVMPQAGSIVGTEPSAGPGSPLPVPHTPNFVDAAPHYRNQLTVVTMPDVLDRRSFRAVNASQPDAWSLATKRGLDIVLSSVAILVILPLLCAVAIAIRLDSAGPVLYRSARVGRKGVVFTCYKFRSMHPDADATKEELRSRNERDGAFFKIADDPRITRLGRCLRRYSLDELPQLWNVLCGDMSLVGPRPHPIDDVDRYGAEDFRRLGFPPGITGLWQITAREDPSFQRCVALDVEYISRWSLLLDFRILARTLPVVLRGSGQ
jgi:lipopolysaccharide/colanic/teichoic acid biosynthesis glycosyltransferase